MRPFLLAIAWRHLTARKRQSVVSLLGIVLGAGFFLGVSSMMLGSENDFIRRLVDNSPHITIEDEYRNATLQPVQQAFSGAAVEIHNIKPETETRGIRGYERVLDIVRAIPGLKASATLTGQALVSYAGKDLGISLNGIVPAEINTVSTIQEYMKAGSISNLVANPDGIVLGSELVRLLSLRMGENITVAATTGQIHTFKIVGIFHTGRGNYDQSQAFTTIKRVQSLTNRANRANSIIIKLSDPYQSRDVASQIEARVGYKSVSWQEASEDIMSALMIRNIIMYSVVSAVLIVAAFGIYNVISTVVMEKHREIAILKSIGFHAGDIERIFLAQGLILGLVGAGGGLPFGIILMFSLGGLEFRIPGGDMIRLPIDWSWYQFALAGGFAIAASVIAAFLPARKAARVRPVDILRGNA